MIGNPQELRALTQDLASGTLTLSTLGVLFETGLLEVLREPHTLDEIAAQHPSFGKSHLQHVLELAAAVGVVGIEADRYRLAPGVLPMTQQPMRASIQGEIRSVLMQSLAVLDNAVRKEPTNGWRHSDPVLLQAQGDSSAGFPAIFKMMIVPQLGDLGERLGRAGGRFLDIGVGVGALSISMCRVWPELRCVGIDIFDKPLAIARDNVSNAKLAERIELRRVPVEQLEDREGFDLAWFPSFFVPTSALAAAAKQLHGAMRPGGWAILATISPTGTSRACASSRLLADIWGGETLATADAEKLLTDAGFTAVRTLPGPPGGGLIVGQRGA
jgi:2-polyprenyl-3-methyl-5-hydroxy-6-metoxy-1,4-benzoquinol methylase